MVSFSKINSFIRNTYKKSLFASNTATCMVLLGVGDCLTQYVEQKTSCFNSPLGVIKATSLQHQQNQTTQMNLTGGSIATNAAMFSIDWLRCCKMFALGTAIGPMQHIWYTFLDRKFPVKTRSVIFKKVFIDQTVFAPLLNLVLIAGLHFIEGGKVETIKESIKSKFLTLYAYDCLLWIPAQLFNFNFVSPQQRVLYINLVTLVWNTITSFVMFNDVSLNSTFE